MAISTNLGGVFTTDLDGNLTSAAPSYVSTENVCGLIFDTSAVGGAVTVFGSGAPQTFKDNFQNGNVVELNSAEDIAKSGIDNTIMSGLPLYHLTEFFKLTGNNQRLFVSFMDSTSDTEFNAINLMQTAANGIIYQIGVWTGEALGTLAENASTATLGTMLSKIKAQTNTIGGVIGEVNMDGHAPVNILVSAPITTAAVETIDVFPDLSDVDAARVSVLVGQANTDAVHEIQKAMRTASKHPLVGCVGAALACLAIAPADESLAHVAAFNLFESIPDAELGFGNLTWNDGTSEYTSVSYTNIKSLTYAERNNKIHKKGYIFLNNYAGLENGIFLSSDQTLTSGDYRTIARCRVMHKSRRVVRQALLPYVNSAVEVDASTGFISTSDITAFQNVVMDALDSNMVQPGTSVPQISGSQVTIQEEQNVLENDQLLIEYRLVPKGCVSAIYVTEGFTTTTSTY